MLAGASREALESLTLQLIEHAGALARRAEVQEDLQAVAHFFEVEACELIARARTAMRFAKYPVSQHERDLLFTEYRVSARPQPA